MFKLLNRCIYIICSARFNTKDQLHRRQQSFAQNISAIEAIVRVKSKKHAKAIPQRDGFCNFVAPLQNDVPSSQYRTEKQSRQMQRRINRPQIRKYSLTQPSVNHQSSWASINCWYVIIPFDIMKNLSL